MKKTKFLFIAALTLTSACHRPLIEGAHAAPKIEVCFTPAMKCRPFIKKAIEEAKKSIYIQSYAFNCIITSQYLNKAHERGVHIEIITDYLQMHSEFSQIHYLRKVGIPILVDVIKGFQHNKIMIIDGEKVITGSYNFTGRAENWNAENIVIINDKKIAEQYMHNWLDRKKHSMLLD